MGQTIDLLKPTAETSKAEEDIQKQQAENEQRRKERTIQLQQELQSMSVKELLRTVMETQQQRVATYQGYNE